MADEIVTVDSLVNEHAAKNASGSTSPTTKTETTNTAGAENTNNNGGGTGSETVVADPVKDLLKEFNVDSVDALRERLKPKEEVSPVVKTPEEKEKEENLRQVDMQRYAVENGLMKPEEFQRLNNLKGKENRSLVYEQWLPSWKEENPDVDPANAERESQAAFDAEYGLSSTNEKTRARGQRRVDQEAGAIRQPLETAYSRVQTEFDEDRAIQADLPNFNKKVSGLIQENIPAQVTLWEGKDGEDQVPIAIDLTDEQRKDLYQKVAKKLSNSGTYQLFKKGDETQLKDIVKRETEAIIWEEHRSAGLTKIAETFLKRGDEKGYKRGSVGAKNPFPMAQEHQKSAGGGHQSAAQEVLESLQGKANK
jgi:hypothetical protein